MSTFGKMAAVLLASSCGPLAGTAVVDRSPPLLVELPVRCTDTVLRTTSGDWVCSLGDTTAVMRGDIVTTVAGGAARVAGDVVWTIVMNGETMGTLWRYADPATGSAAASFDLTYPATYSFLGTFPLEGHLAREQGMVMNRRGVEVISVVDGGLALSSQVESPFTDAAGHNGTFAVAFFEADDTIWGIGLGASGNEKACPFSWPGPATAITESGPCVLVPANFLATAYGGIWTSVTDERAHFFRASGTSLTKVSSIELPVLPWSGSTVPMAHDPSGKALLVARVEGDRLTLDRYRDSPDFIWSGATEQWVWQISADGWSTRVFAR